MSSQDAHVREQIRRLESGLAEWQASHVLDLLRLRSDIEAFVSGQEALGRDLPVERARLTAIDATLERQSVRMVGAAARKGGLRAARSHIAPPRKEWWWYLDERVAERMRRTAIHLSVALIGGLLLFLLGTYVRNTFFRMDPHEKEAFGYAALAEQMLYLGEYEAALERYEQAVAARPDLAEAWVSLTVLYGRQGRNAEAQAARARAEQLISDPLRLRLALARRYELAQDPDQALLLAEEAVRMAPASAEARLVRGDIYNSQGERDLALADFELASELAREHGQEALYVLARARMDVLLQQDPFPLPGGIAP